MVETGVGQTTIQKLIRGFREMLIHWLLEYSETIDCSGNTVKTDENALRRIKYTRGQLTEVHRVIDTVDGDIKKCFFNIMGGGER